MTYENRCDRCGKYFEGYTLECPKCKAEKESLIRQELLLQKQIELQQIAREEENEARERKWEQNEFDNSWNTAVKSLEDLLTLIEEEHPKAPMSLKRFLRKYGSSYQFMKVEFCAALLDSDKLLDLYCDAVFKELLADTDSYRKGKATKILDSLIHNYDFPKKYGSAEAIVKKQIVDISETPRLFKGPNEWASDIKSSIADNADLLATFCEHFSIEDNIDIVSKAENVLAKYGDSLVLDASLIEASFFDYEMAGLLTGPTEDQIDAYTLMREWLSRQPKVYANESLLKEVRDHEKKFPKRIADKISKELVLYEEVISVASQLLERVLQEKMALEERENEKAEIRKREMHSAESQRKLFNCALFFGYAVAAFLTISATLGRNVSWEEAAQEGVTAGVVVLGIVLSLIVAGILFAFTHRQ